MGYVIPKGAREALMQARKAQGVRVRPYAMPGEKLGAHGRLFRSELTRMIRAMHSPLSSTGLCPRRRISAKDIRTPSDVRFWAERVEYDHNTAKLVVLTQYVAMVCAASWSKSDLMWTLGAMVTTTLLVTLIRGFNSPSQVL